MGLAGISPGSLILIFLILLLLFGKNRITEMAEELGNAVKVFKKTMDEDSSEKTTKESKTTAKDS